MSDRKSKAARKKTVTKPQFGEGPMKPAGEVTVIRQDLPSSPPEDKRIHPRRPLPLVPEAPASDTGRSTFEKQTGSGEPDSK
jgi:hypothetical protein